MLLGRRGVRDQLGVIEFDFTQFLRSQNRYYETIGAENIFQEMNRCKQESTE
jgi:hypothetical protein